MNNKINLNETSIKMKELFKNFMNNRKNSNRFRRDLVPFNNHSMNREDYILSRIDELNYSMKEALRAKSDLSKEYSSLIKSNYEDSIEEKELIEDLNLSVNERNLINNLRGTENELDYCIFFKERRHYILNELIINASIDCYNEIEDSNIKSSIEARYILLELDVMRETSFGIEFNRLNSLQFLKKMSSIDLAISETIKSTNKTDLIIDGEYITKDNLKERLEELRELEKILKD